MPEHVFTERARSFDQLPWFNDPLILEWAAKILSEEGSSVVDVGAGTGLAIDALSKYFGRVRGIEPNFQMFQHGKQKLESCCLPPRLDGPEVSWDKLTFQEFSIEPPEYDILFFKNSLHHIGDLTSTIASALSCCTKAVAVLDVVGPSDAATQFAKKIVLMKEPERNANTFVSTTYAALCRPHYWLSAYFDQFIIVEQWLSNAGASEELSDKIIQSIQLAPANIREAMQIHSTPTGLKMLRRNELCIFRKQRHTDNVAP